MLATGRMFRSVLPYAIHAGLGGLVVCYGGAVVADLATGRFLRHEPIPLELAREALAELEARGFPTNAYVDDELYVAKHTPESERYARFQHLVAHTVGPLLEWLEQPPTKLVAIGRPDALDELGRDLRASFDGRLYVAKSLPFFLELGNPGVSKATGVGFVAEHDGFSRSEAIAFGDGENDVELLEWAGYGVAVANGHERALAAADFVAPSVDDEGVAQVLEAFLDLPE